MKKKEVAGGSTAEGGVIGSGENRKSIKKMKEKGKKVSV
jgi:hypothetical protein